MMEDGIWMGGYACDGAGDAAETSRLRLRECTVQGTVGGPTIEVMGRYQIIEEERSRRTVADEQDRRYAGERGSLASTRQGNPDGGERSRHRQGCVRIVWSVGNTEWSVFWRTLQPGRCHDVWGLVTAASG